MSGKSAMERMKEIQEMNRRNAEQFFKKQKLEKPEKNFERNDGKDGCIHYLRSCKLVSPCCDKVFGCRMCHDEIGCDVKFDRYNVKEIVCIKCNLRQPISNECINLDCKIQFAKYFCNVCNFFDDSDRKVYHCEKCKLCRLGEGLGIDYFHCDKCNACMHMSLQDHKCVEKTLNSDCPVCSDYLFTSTTPVMFLNCGHTIHVSCYEKYTKTNYICPICCKSLADMTIYFNRLDEWMLHEQLPKEYENLTNKVYCNDCEKFSITKFHFTYHKCAECGSYNTKVSETFGEIGEIELPIPEVPQPVDEQIVPQEEANLEDESPNC